MKRSPGADYPALLRTCRLLARKSKRLVECIAYGIFDRIVLLGWKRQVGPNTVAIVHFELLGDYVLWLPYGRAMVEHFQSRHQQVVLVLNAAVLPLAKRHFPNCTLIGIDRGAFVRNLSIRVKTLRQLRQVGANVTYHGTYPRDGIVEDAAVRALHAPAWGFDATFLDRPWIDRWLSRRLYIHLLSALPNVHQSRRHRAFLHALGITDNELNPHFNFLISKEGPKSRPYIIVAPGASQSERCWPVQSFVALVKQILAIHPDWQCIVVGIHKEQRLGEAIVESVGHQVINLAGKTDLVEMMTWVAQAKLVLGNDSAVCHIAAACGIPSLAIIGGGHYGRCFPYDSEENRSLRSPITVSKKMDCFGCDWICRYSVAKEAPYPCIAAISPEMAWDEVTKLLSQPNSVISESSLLDSRPLV